MSNDGLCAIITGSASGLGAATAVILAKGGARIVINYSSSQKEAEQTADLCRSAGGEVVVVQGDVSRDEDCRKIAVAAASWGRLDALINNAGTTKHMAHDNMDGLSAEDFQRIFGVNTIACWSLNLQYGVGGVMNFAFIMFQSIGAYIGGVLTLGPSTGASFQQYILGASLPFPLP